MGIMEKKKVCKHFKKLNAHTCECFVFQNASVVFTLYAISKYTRKISAGPYEASCANHWQVDNCFMCVYVSSNADTLFQGRCRLNIQSIL
jgi:hypothetical protein